MQFRGAWRAAAGRQGSGACSAGELIRTLEGEIGMVNHAWLGAATKWHPYLDANNRATRKYAQLLDGNPESRKQIPNLFLVPVGLLLRGSINE